MEKHEKIIRNGLMDAPVSQYKVVSNVSKEDNKPSSERNSRSFAGSAWHTHIWFGFLTQLRVLEHIHTHTHQFGISNPLNLHVFGLWGETEGNLRWHGENIQTLHRKDWLKPGTFLLWGDSVTHWATATPRKITNMDPKEFVCVCEMSSFQLLLFSPVWSKDPLWCDGTEKQEVHTVPNIIFSEQTKERERTQKDCHMDMDQ